MSVLIKAGEAIAGLQANNEKLREAHQRIYDLTQGNPEMWLTDLICKLNKDALAETPAQSLRNKEGE